MPPTAHRAGLALVTCVALVAAGLARTTPAGERPPGVRFPFGEAEARTFQDDYAKAAGLPKEITNGLGMKLVLIPPGRFEMGPNGSKYRVTLAKPFYAGVTEITLGQYRKFRPGHRVAGRTTSSTRTTSPRRW